MQIPEHCTDELRKAFVDAHTKCDNDPDDGHHPVTRGLDAVLKMLRDQQPAKRDLAYMVITEDDIRQRSKEFQDVKDFHTKFGLLNFDTPGHLSAGKLKERVEFLLEELKEFAEAAGVLIQAPNRTDVGVFIDDQASQDLAKQADALIDLVYVACGTAVMLGLPWDWLWDDVQRANMAKVRGVTHRGHAVDVKKPEGWQGPQGLRILNLAGYKHDEWFGCGPTGNVNWILIEENCRDDTQRDE